MLNNVIQQGALRKVIFLAGLVMVGLVIFSFVIDWSIWRVITVIAGVILSLFLPGFFVTKALFPEAGKWRDLGRERDGDIKSIDALESIILSLFFSIALVAVCFTVLRQAGLIFSSTTVVVVVLGLNILTMIAALLRRAKK